MKKLMRKIVNNRFKALKCDGKYDIMGSLQNTVFAVGKEN